MLDFFRKYQKIFFIFITAIIVVSFTFFGAFNAFTQKGEKIPTRCIGKTLDGKEVTDADVRALLEFMQAAANRDGLSLFDELVVKSGLGRLVAEVAFAEIKEEISQRYQKVRQFVPYAHPQAQLLNAKEVWNRFAPEVSNALTAIQMSQGELDAAQIENVFLLYSAQKRFPPALLKQILQFQEMHSDGVKPDPLLAGSELAIAGFQTLEDWFGPLLLEKLGVAILNGGSYAKKKGITVSVKEARENLYQVTAKQLTAYHRRKEISRQEVQRVIYYQLHSFGVEESRAVELWQAALAFHKTLEETTASVFLDRLIFDQRARDRRQEAKVALYQLPASLRFRDISSLLKFERYLEAVAGDVPIAELPHELLEPDMVEKRFPELVKREVEVEIAEVTKTELVGRISLKQTWDFELEEANFIALIQDFPLLGSKPAKTKEDRFAALQELDDRTRLQVDQAARLLILHAHPEWIDEELQKAPWQLKTLQLRLKGKSAPVKGIKEDQQLLALLQEGENVEKVTFDGEHFYAIRLRQLPEEKQLLTFEEANVDGTLDKLLDRQLEAAYSSMQETGPLRDKNGAILTLEKAKDQLGVLLYKDRLEAIRRYAQKISLSDEELPAYRFDAYLESKKQEYIMGKKSISNAQWALTMSQESWMQGGELFAAAEKLQPGEWSTSLCGTFFQLIDRVPGSASSEEIRQAQQALAEEARRLFLQKIIPPELYKKTV